MLYFCSVVSQFCIPTYYWRFSFGTFLNCCFCGCIGYLVFFKYFLRLYAENFFKWNYFRTNCSFTQIRYHTPFNLRKIRIFLFLKQFLYVQHRFCFRNICIKKKKKEQISWESDNLYLVDRFFVKKNEITHILSIEVISYIRLFIVSKGNL